MEIRKDFMLVGNQEIEQNNRLSAKSKRRLKKSKAFNTIKSYASDWNDFADWCDHHGLESLPAEPETIVNYINDLADNAKANTVSRRVTAISENYIAAGYKRDNPAHSGLVRNAIAAIRREKGTFQHGKAPILLETLYLLSDSFGDDETSIRDKALLLLGFAGAFRRSELVSLLVEDITFSSEGMVVFIGKSKSDQLGKGNYIGIPYAPDSKICAVRALKAWLSLSGLKRGPIFRPFKRNHELRDAQLSDKSVALIVKKYIKRAGLNEADFAGHSLRRGFATSAAQHDVDALTIMRQTRHKSEKMVHRYIEQGNIFKDNPLARMFGK